MRRWTLILCLALIAAFLISLTGCTPAPAPSTTPTQPTQPSQPTAPTEPTTPTEPTEPPTEPTESMPDITDMQQLISTVYVTDIDAIYGRILTPTPAELTLIITQYADGQEAVSLDMTHVKNLFSDKLDFQDDRNSFTLQKLDAELPLYYVTAKIYRENTRNYDNFDFFIDFETETILFRPRGIPVHYYSVASADPTVHPCDIVEYFLPYLNQLFPPWEGLEETMYPVPNRAEQHFCYDLTGTWLNADGHALEQMDFQLVGNLTDKVYMNDDLERNLLFLWPEHFGYENAEPVSESITLTVQEAGPNYHGIGLLRHTQSGELVTYWFNIFPEDEIVILQMDGKYLVCSTRNDLDAADILSQYQDRLISHNAQAVSWEMTAFMLKADGTVANTGTMRITGYIRYYNERFNYLVLDIDFPEGFRFDTSIPGPYGNIGDHIMTDDPNDNVCSSIIYDSITHDFTDTQMLINSEKEYYLGIFDVGYARYLAACTDPNTTADEILAHFWDYLERNGHTS